MRIAFSVLLLWAAASVASLSQEVSHRGIVDARRFGEDSSLVAHAHETIILDTPAGDSNDTTIPYELDKGKHDFCFEGQKPYFAGITLEDASGKALFTLPDHKRCATATLPKGIYRLRLKHSGKPQPGSAGVGSVQVDVPGPPLADANNKPVGGYWAIAAPPAAIDPNLQGRLRAQLPFRELDPLYFSNVPLIADYSSLAFDEYSLFSFPDNPADQHPILLANGSLGNPLFLDLIYHRNYQSADDYSVIACDSASYLSPCLSVYGYDVFSGIGSSPGPLVIHDLGRYQFTFSFPYANWGLQFQFTAAALGAVSPLQGYKDSNPSDGATMNVLFRYFPDSTQMGELKEGEVALSNTCNFQGKSVVFGNSVGALAQYDSPATQLGSMVAWRLGNNTALQPPERQSSGDDSFDLFAPEGCGQAGDFSYVNIVPLDVALRHISNTAGNIDVPCPNCKLVGADLGGLIFYQADLQGADLSGADLSGTSFFSTSLDGAKFINTTFRAYIDPNTTLRGADFTGGSLSNISLNQRDLTGVKFVGAVLNWENFQGSTLTRTDFTNAKLTCVDLSGTDKQHLRDLTLVDMTGVQWLPYPSCKSNLSYTKISIANVPPASWKNINLTGAVFVDLKPGMQLSTQANPLDLTGAVLAGVSLEQVSLDYAKLSGADLTQISLSNSSLQHVELSGAKLYGAQLNNTNLDGAKLAGAYLTKPPGSGAAAANLAGAFLRNVNLSQAQLDGANFTNASFYGFTAAGQSTCAIDPNTGFTSGCATAKGATMNNTQFSDAYLFGVDFTNTQIQGVQFANAVLVGANFAGATVSLDSSVGTNSGFTGAYLQGANLDGVRLQTGLYFTRHVCRFQPNRERSFPWLERRSYDISRLLE